MPLPKPKPPTVTTVPPATGPDAGEATEMTGGVTYRNPPGTGAKSRPLTLTEKGTVPSRKSSPLRMRKLSTRCMSPCGPARAPTEKCHAVVGA